MEIQITTKYFLLFNGNSDLLALNPYLKKIGYQIVEVTVNDIEGRTNFLELHNSESNFYISLHGHLDWIMEETFEFPHNKTYLLKEKSKHWQRNEKQGTDFGWTQINDLKQPISLMEQLGVFNYNDKIISKINLFLTGDIHAVYAITLNEQTRKLIHYEPIEKYNVYPQDIKLDNKKIALFERVIIKDFKFPELIELAIATHDEYDQVSNKKLAYVSLVAGLESIFNRSSAEPIQHILSRHSALLLATSEKQFDTIYKLVKVLYAIRSAIVHGETNKNKLKKIEAEFNQSIINIRHLSKKIIIELLWQSFIDDSALNKDDLFEKLNKKGLSSDNSSSIPGEASFK